MMDRANALDGKCARHSPVCVQDDNKEYRFQLTNDYGRAIWPHTTWEDFCGDYEKELL